MLISSPSIPSTNFYLDIATDLMKCELNRNIVFLSNRCYTVGFEIALMMA